MTRLSASNANMAKKLSNLANPLEAIVGISSERAGKLLESLTERELEIAKLMATGAKNKSIAAELGISMKTLDIHRANLKCKLRTRGPVDVARIVFAKALEISDLPTSQKGGFAAIPPEADDLWTMVHDEVQSTFDRLESAVRHHLKDVDVSAFRTQGDKFYLFTYRTFSMPDANDPVVVGITFSPQSDGITIEADVSGEQTGDSIFSLPIKSIPMSKDRILAVARVLAANLCQAAERIVNALRDPNRKAG